MRGTERVQPTNPPFQKIEDAVRSTGLSAYFLRRGCCDGSIPCVRSGRTIYINIPALLRQYNEVNHAGNSTLVCGEEVNDFAIKP